MSKIVLSDLYQDFQLYSFILNALDFVLFLNLPKTAVRRQVLDLIPVNEAMRCTTIQTSEGEKSQNEMPRSRLLVSNQPGWPQFPFIPD